MNRLRIPVSIRDEAAQQVIEQLHNGNVYPLEDLSIVAENVASRGTIYVLMGSRLISLDKCEPIRDMVGLVLGILGMTPYIMTIEFQCGTVYKIDPTGENGGVRYKYYPPKREGVN